nr:hypothetical protein [Paraburkholderia polaris]
MIPVLHARVELRKQPEIPRLGGYPNWHPASVPLDMMRDEVFFGLLLHAVVVSLQPFRVLKASVQQNRAFVGEAVTPAKEMRHVYPDGNFNALNGIQHEQAQGAVEVVEVNGQPERRAILEIVQACRAVVRIGLALWEPVADQAVIADSLQYSKRGTFVVDPQVSALEQADLFGVRKM